METGGPLTEIGNRDGPASPSIRRQRGQRCAVLSRLSGAWPIAPRLGENQPVKAWPGTRQQNAAPLAAVYGAFYGMEKTTVYVPAELKRALGRLASARGTSEAALIREASRNIVAGAPAPRPRLPLIESGKPMLAERLDEALEGFGRP